MTQMTQPRSPKPLQIYQLRVTLEDIEPPIWRQFQVPSDITLRHLHDVLQVVMGWFDYHLYQFIAHGHYYGEPDVLDLDPTFHVHLASRTKVRSIAPKVGSTFVYEYDFGDGWRHQLVVEAILPINRRFAYPRCIAGERACPPEDCGGVPGYEELLSILANPEHPEYRERLEWLGGEFDSEAFDVKATNRALKAISAQRL